jgi:uncharacterized repeat protein (TIGR01451 family)
MRILITLFPLLFALANTSSAQFWVKTEGPHGGGGYICSAPNGKLYAKDQVFLTSTDDALSWQKMPVQPPGLTVHAAADGKLFSWGNSNFYRSDDEGATWSLTNTAGYWDAYTKVLSAPDGTLFAGDGGRFYRSEDYGTTWSQVFNFLTILGTNTQPSYYKDPYSTLLYAGISLSNPPAFHLFRSSDGGNSWEEIFTANHYFYSDFGYDMMLTTPAGHIFVTGDENALVHRSTDGGNTWQALALSPTEPNETWGLARTTTGRLLCNAWSKSYFSDNNGTTWQPLPGKWHDDAGRFIALASGVNLTFSFSILRSTDDGMNWGFGSTGFSSSIVRSIAFRNNLEIYAETPDGLFKTTDGGNTWQLLLFNHNFGQSKVALDEQGNVFYAAGNKCWRSTDAGASFTEITPPLQAGSFIYNVRAMQEGKVFLGTSDGFWKSENNGTSWTVLGANAPFNFKRIEQHPEGYLLAVYANGFTRSNDGGNTWSLLPTPTQANLADFGISAQGRVYTGSNPYFYWSHDGCLTWNTVQVAMDQFDSFSPDQFAANEAGHIFMGAVEAKPVRRSVDGGLSWNFLPDIPTPSVGAITTVEVSPTQHLFAAVSGDGLWRSTEPTTNITFATGKLWQDLGTPDCLPSPPDTLLPHFLIRTESSDGKTIFGYANDLATFLLPVEEGSYEVAAVPPNPYWDPCLTLLDVPQSALQTTIDSVDLRIQAVEQCPWMEVDIATGLLRRCFPGSYWVKWCNKGTVTAQNASVTVTLDSFLAFTGASIPPTAVVGNEISFALGDVPPGHCGQFNLAFEVSCDAQLGQVHCSKVQALPDTICPSWAGARLRLTGGCTGTEAYATIHNDGGGMNSPLKYFYVKWLGDLAIGSGSGNFQLAAGASQSIYLPVNGEQVHFWVEQPTGYFFGEENRLDIQHCNAPIPGLPVNVFTSNYLNEPFADEICLENQGSFDPNDKQGFPEGLSDKGFIAKTQSLEYLIRFQNTGTDTAFTVVVRDTLSPWLDPATLRLGASSHPCELQISGEGNLSFRFDQIMLPESNINEPASHGFVTFTISQHHDNPNGTEILNRANIYFDFNEPVETNATRHTVGIPSSVGTKEPKAPPMVRLFPNPFEAELTIQLEPSGNGGGFSYRLLDLTGRVADAGDFEGTAFTYRNEGLAAGFYLLEIRSERGGILATKKVIKQ